MVTAESTPLRLVGWLIDDEIYTLHQVPVHLLSRPAQAVYVKRNEEVRHVGLGTTSAAGK